MVWSVYSILNFSGPRQVPGLGRIQNARKAGPWAEFVYSNFPGPGRFLIDPRTKSVYSDFPGPSRLLFWGVYRKLEKPGPGQNLYTQIFRARAGSCSGAYTASSKIQGPRARTVYSNFPGPGRLLVWGVYRKLEKPGPGQNQYTQIFRIWAGSWSRAYTEARKAEPRAESVYSNFQGSGRLLF